MKSIASRLSLVLAMAALMAAETFLVANPLDACRGYDVPQPRVESSAVGPMPTLAPPQKVVLVQVEVDKSDIEVGWDKNYH
jgi:hypothetical protein